MSDGGGVMIGQEKEGRMTRHGRRTRERKNMFPMPKKPLELKEKDKKGKERENEREDEREIS